MTSRCARAAARIASILCWLALPAGLLWAQNENETTGFQSNHIFESGQFGENIDILNGGLHLSIPIGPRYQVNDRLGYGLVLHYNSKVWDYSHYMANDATSVNQYNEGPFGIGFTLNLGRLLQDSHWLPNSNSVTRTWKWVTPDGNQHDVWTRENAETVPAPTAEDWFGNKVSTLDTSYVRILTPGIDCRSSVAVPANEREDANCFTVKSPDGLTYTLGHQVPAYPDSNNLYRDDNLSFGGWYVTRIEDRSVGTQAGGLYSVNVRVEYDSRPGFEHLIKKIVDTHGRTITFTNCKCNTSGICDPMAVAADLFPGTSIYNRDNIATCQIDVPAFSWTPGSQSNPSESVIQGAKASYTFNYAYTPMTHTFRATPNSSATVGPVLELIRLDYPAYTKRDQTTANYSLYFGYSGVNGGSPNRGELSCRTLPVAQDVSKNCYTYAGVPTFRYDYSYYDYAGLFLTGQGGGITKSNSASVYGPSISNSTRQVFEKRIVGLDSRVYKWTYTRALDLAFTNPRMVTVTDSVTDGPQTTLGNDTVYYYHATLPAIDTAPASENGSKPDDGLAPDWDDGLNYRIEYYRGSGTSSRQLVRSKTMEYEADTTTLAPGATDYKKANTRERRVVTIFNDNQGGETVVSRAGWDDFGNYRTVSENGVGVQGTRTTFTDYSPAVLAGAADLYMTGLSNYVEVHNGVRVLKRTDTDYTTGRPHTTIARKSLPAAIGQPRDMTTLGPGDVKTVYDYDASTGAILSKTLSRKDEQTQTLVDEYCIGYTWNQGAYLKSKTFKDCTSGDPIGGNVIDRMRDGNTGAIFSTKDTAGVETKYKYDSLGRLTDITPVAEEFPTEVDYVSLTETTVKRGDATNYQFSRYQYDGLGKVIREEKRPADPAGGNPYQTTCYDIESRITFKSEWMKPGSYSGPNPCDRAVFPGTTFDYGTPPDPFGRVQQVTTADNQVTTTSYQGQDTTVTVNNVMGVGVAGGSGSVTTTYRRDGWGRLFMVDAPSERRCFNWGAVCTKDADCGGSTNSCRASDGADAMYYYDLLDNLVEVELVDQSTQKKQPRFFEYDALNRLYSSYNPESGTTVFTAHDSLGNVLSSSDASGTTLKYTYDRAGRLTSLERVGSPNMLLLENTYDSVSAGVSPKGKLTLSKAYREDGGGGPSSLVLQEAFTYSGIAGRLSAQTSTFAEWPGFTGQTVSFSYDAFGNLSSTGYPQGGSGSSGGLATVYDFANGIPVAVKDGLGTVLASVTYNAAGGVETLTTLGGARTWIEPDNRNRPKEITIGRWNGISFQGTPYYQSNRYVYDGAGNIHRMNYLDNSARNKYYYDSSNRLKEAYETQDGVNYMQCFAYDAYGNMIGKVDRVGVSSTETCQGALAATWDYMYSVTPPSGTNTNRVLTEQIGSSQVATFIYDARGNLTKDWERRYLYDSRNRLTSIYRVADFLDATAPATELGRYDYDADGNRIVKRDTARDLTTYYLRGPDGKLLTEFRRTAIGTYTPEWVKHHVYLAGREVGFRDNRVPSPPGRITATTTRQGNNATVKLQWKKNPSEELVASYGVYRATWGGSMVFLTSTTGNCTPDAPDSVCYSDAVTADTNYSYQIVAVAGPYSSYGSDIVELMAGDNVGPPAPTCQRLKAGDRQVTVTWTPPTTEVPQGYNVYRSTSQSGQKPLITQSLVQGTTYVDAGLTNGTTYYYSVKAVDMVGNTSVDIVNTGCSPAADTSAQPKDYAAPGPPMNLVVSADCQASGTAALSWDPNPDTDQVAVYKVYRQRSGGPIEDRITNGTPNTSFNDTGLMTGSIYYYWVVALDLANNPSLPSQKVGVAQRTSAVPVPPGKLFASGEDGQVRLKIIPPTNSTQVGTLVVYRKPNAVSSCGAYQQVGQVSSVGYLRCTNDPSHACSTDAECAGGQCKVHNWIGVTSVDYVDGAVPNNLAWDYAVAARDYALNESALSEPALAIPLAAPKDFRECVELGPSGVGGDCTSTCNVSGGPCRNHVVAWAPPATDPYQPMPAEGSNGALSYLLGYHARRYRYIPVSGSVDGDQSTFTEENLGYLDTRYKLRCTQNPSATTLCSSVPSGESVCGDWDTCVPTGTCETVEAVACPAAGCMPGTACIKRCSNNLGQSCQNNNGCPGGTCDNVCVSGAYDCIQQNDCPAGAWCKHEVYTPVDPYLLQTPGPRIVYPHRSTQGSSCVTIQNVYKVYANGDWLTATSLPSSNFDLTKTSPNASSAGYRCVSWMFDVCNLNAPLCQPATEPPEITVAPNASIPLDASGKKIPGKLTVTWSPPANPADQARIAGYYLYVIESSGVLPYAPYGFRRPQPFITIAPGQPYYEFTTLPRDGRGTDDLATNTNDLISYQFQVAAFDTQGRVGKASALSAPAKVYDNVSSLPRAPLGLKTVIWTVNDASVDGHGTLGSFEGNPNPRSYEGIKLQWKSGQWASLLGFRVYRSETEMGGYCAMVQPGGSGLDAPPCPNPSGLNSLFSTTLTRADSEAGNDRFFHDKTAVPGIQYYYKVKSIGDSTSTTAETAFSEVTSGMALEHPAQPLSPPRHFKAWAPWVNDNGQQKGLEGINLRWCPNRPQEQVTGYNIYRSPTSGGPYKRIAYITAPAAKGDDCLLGSRRCTINCVTPPCNCSTTPCGTANSSSVTLDQNACTFGLGGSCKIVDLGIVYPDISETAANQADNVYYYVVTAVRGSQESAYSQENAAWPNYWCATCPPTNYMPKYDQDNSGDLGCDDETSSLEVMEDANQLALIESGVFKGFADLGEVPYTESESDSMSPYRVIGIRKPGGGGGGSNPPPPPTGQWRFLHADHLGSPRVVVDDGGNKISAHHYMPFGDEKPLAGALTSNHMKFTGHERDAESASADNPDGLDYMLARHYNDSFGRFTSPDVLGGTDPSLPQSWNAYSYVQNNPLTFRDASGLSPAPTYHTTLVPVSGSTAEEAFQDAQVQMEKRSNKKHSGWVAFTDPTFGKPEIKSDGYKSGDTFVARNVSFSISLHVEIYLPRWIAPPDASGQQQVFNNDVANRIVPHENRHKQVAIDGQRMFEERVMSITGKGKTPQAAEADRAKKTQAAIDEVNSWMDKQNYEIDHPGGVTHSGYYGGGAPRLLVDNVDVSY